MGPKCQVSGIVRVRQLTMLAFVTTEKDTWKASSYQTANISQVLVALILERFVLMIFSPKSAIRYMKRYRHFLHQKEDGQVKRSIRANSNDPPILLN